MFKIGDKVVQGKRLGDVIAFNLSDVAIIKVFQGNLEYDDGTWQPFPFKIGDEVFNTTYVLPGGEITKICDDGECFYGRSGGALWWKLKKFEFKVGDLVTTPTFNSKEYAEIINIRDSDVELLSSNGDSLWFAKSSLAKYVDPGQPWWPGAFITYIKTELYTGDPSNFKMRLMADGKGVEWVCADADGVVDKLAICPDIFHSGPGNLRLMTPTEIRDCKKYFEPKQDPFKAKTIYRIQGCFAEWHEGAFHFMDGSIESNKAYWSKWKIIEAETVPNVEKVAMAIQRVGGSSVGWWNLSIESRKDWRKTARAACNELGINPNGIS